MSGEERALDPGSPPNETLRAEAARTHVYTHKKFRSEQAPSPGPVLADMEQWATRRTSLRAADPQSCGSDVAQGGGAP